MMISASDLNFGNLRLAHDTLWEDGVAVFERFISPEQGEYLYRLVFESNTKDLLRCDFQKNSTPRHLQTLNGLILNEVPELTELYSSPMMLEQLNRILNGREIDPSRPQHNDVRAVLYGDALDNMFATRLSKAGDTHGYHYDYPFLGLVICLRAAPEGMGGTPEFLIVYARGYCVETKSLSLKPGDAYLMRTTDTYHSVTPLKGSFERAMLSLSFDCHFADQAGQWLPLANSERGVCHAESAAAVFTAG